MDHQKKKFPAKTLWLILIIVAVNLMLRSVWLDRPSLHMDEAYSIFTGQFSIRDLVPVFRKEANPPLYFLLLKGWMTLGGQSVWWTRFLSVIFSCLGIGVLFVWARRHLNLFTAIGIVCVLSASNHLMYHAQEVRAFALLFLLYSCSLFYFSNFLKEGKVLQLYLLVLFNVLLIYTHYTSVVWMALQVAIYLFFYRDAPRFVNLGKAFGLAAVFALPLILFLTPEKFAGGASWVKRIGPEMALNEVFTFFNDDFQAYFFSCSLLFSLVLIPFITEKDNRKQLKLFLFIAIGGIIIVYFLSLIKPFFQVRYMQFILVFWIICGVYALSLLKYRIPAILVLIMVCWMGFRHFRLAPAKAENWKAAVEWGGEKQKEGATIFVSPVYMYRPYAYYFDKDAFKDYTETHQRLFKSGVLCFDQIDTSSFEYLLPEKVILMQAHQAFIDPEGGNLKTLNTRYELVGERDFQGISVYEFELNPAR